MELNTQSSSENFEHLIKECFVCGGKLNYHKNKATEGFTYYCDKPSKYNYYIGGTSHYEIVSLPNAFSIFISIDSMKWKIQSNKIYENQNVYVFKYIGFGQVDTILTVKFDLINFMKDNTKIELIDKIETLLVFK